MKTTAIPVSLLQSPSEARLAAHLPDFVTLTKPRVTELAVFTALVGMIIAPGHLDPLLGSIAVAGGAAPPVSSICGATPRCPPAAFLIHGADGGQADHEPRAGQAPRRRPIVASAPR